MGLLNKLLCVLGNEIVGSHKELLFKKHDLFDAAESEEQRMLLRYEIRTIIDNVDSPDAQDLHILGLVHYHTSDDNIDIAKSHEFFQAALEVDSKYNMARLYSAHCYHDRGELTKALEDYLAVDSTELQSEFAIWRYVKLQEQIGYCHHKLGELNLAESYFGNVLSFYESEPYDELVDPVEIYECLDESDKIYQDLKAIENAYYQQPRTT